MYAYVLFNVADERYVEEILQFPNLAQAILPASYDTLPDVYRHGDFILFAWHANFDPHQVRQRINPGVTVSEDGASFFASGYLGEGMIDNPQASTAARRTSGIFDLIDHSGQGISLSDSPGGVSSNVFVKPDGKTAHCWSTQPPAIPTFYARNRKGFCVVGNRPRLVHAASVLSTGYTYSAAYLPKYLATGYAFDCVTPFSGVNAVPPNRSLHVANGACEVQPYPMTALPPIPADEPLDVKSRELAGLLQAACWPAAAMKRANIFLSGGKDSRSLSCALYGTADLSAFTFGDVAYGEGSVAKEVAATLGANFEARSQHIISDPIKALAHSNRATDGLGINFAHQFDFRYELAFTEGLPTYHGHGHLLRGGFARTMAGSKEQLTQALHRSFLSPFATEEANAALRTLVDAWWEERRSDFRDGRDVLMYAQQDHRLGLFTAPSSMDLTARTFMVYPLLDERIARHAARMCAFDRISERVLFGAMQVLAKDLTEIPLFGSIWRLDRDPDRRVFVDSDHNFQDGYQKRRPASATKHLTRADGKPAFTFDADRAGMLTRNHPTTLVMDSSKLREIESCVTSEVMTEVRSLALTGRYTDNHNKLDANTRANMGSFVKRIVVAASLYDLRW